METSLNDLQREGRNFLSRTREENDEPAQIAKHYVSHYSDIECIIELMLSYFDLKIDSTPLVVTTWVEWEQEPAIHRFHAALLDELKNPGGPLLEALGKPPIFTFMCEYKNFRNRNNISLIPPDAIARKLKTLNFAARYPEVESALSDVLQCIKSEAGERHQRMSSWGRIRVYEFSLNLRLQTALTRSSKRLEPRVLLDGEATVEAIQKERRALFTFAQDPKALLLLHEQRRQKIRTLQDNIRTLEQENKEKIEGYEKQYVRFKDEIRNQVVKIHEMTLLETSQIKKIDELRQEIADLKAAVSVLTVEKEQPRLSKDSLRGEMETETLTVSQQANEIAEPRDGVGDLKTEEKSEAANTKSQARFPRFGLWGMLLNIGEQTRNATQHHEEMPDQEAKRKYRSRSG